MGEMRNATYAAMLLAFVEPQQLTTELVRKAANAIRARGHIAANLERALAGADNQEWMQRKLEQVTGGLSEWSLEVEWSRRHDGPTANQSGVQYVMDSRNKDQLKVPGMAVLRMFTIPQRMPPFGDPRISQMVESFKDVVKAVRPRFAVLDHHHDVIRQRSGMNPQRLAWGAMYYDAPHAKAIGVEALHNCAAAIKEEWPAGGWWIQTWANPFVVASELTDQIALDLDLKNAKFPA